MVCRTLLAVSVFVLLSLTIQQTAAAHADLERSEPAAGTELDLAPAQVDMWFSEELSEGSTVEVTSPGGKRVDNDDAAIDLFDPERKHLVITLAPLLEAGTYTVAWTTISGEDDDTHSGTFEFFLTISATPQASPAGIASPRASPEASPSPEADTTMILTQATPSDDTAKPSMRAFAIALGVGAGAAMLILGFWLLVKPRK